ncbi:MAG: J domain-containing protein [Myxococcales bacterium]|nr:J domain-containing protein [Myxococcales bacterium]
MAGRSLTAIDSRWARAWLRALRGETPTVDQKAEPVKPNPGGSAGPTRASVWAILGLPPEATVDEIKRAYRRRALETHPDRGGDAEVFRAVQSAYERALIKRQKGDKRPKRKR